MPDDLYDRDFVTWSAEQARKLRRLSRGEQVNDIDWRHVVMEVADLGKRETKSVRKLLLRALEHLLRVVAFPTAPDHAAWLHEANTFLIDAKLDWSPGMDRQIRLADLYAIACREVLDLSYREGPATPLPLVCPVGLRDMLPRRDGDYASAKALIEKFRAAPP